MMNVVSKHKRILPNGKYWVRPRRCSTVHVVKARVGPMRVIFILSLSFPCILACLFSSHSTEPRPVPPYTHISSKQVICNCVSFQYLQIKFRITQWGKVLLQAELFEVGFRKAHKLSHPFGLFMDQGEVTRTRGQQVIDNNNGWRR